MNRLRINLDKNHKMFHVFLSNKQNVNMWKKAAKLHRIDEEHFNKSLIYWKENIQGCFLDSPAQKYSISEWEQEA